MIAKLLCFILLLCIPIIWRRRKIYALARQLKNDIPALPFIGHGYLFMGSDEDRMNTLQLFGRIAVNDGGFTGLWIGTNFVTVIADPVAAETVLRTCSDKDDLMKIAPRLLGNGSVFAPVHIWRHRRKIITPVFSSQSLQKFFKISVKQSSLMVEKLQEVSEKEVFSIWEHLSAYTLDSVCESTFGEKIIGLKYPDQYFLECLRGVLKFAAEFVLRPPLYRNLFRKPTIELDYIKGVLDGIIREKRAQLHLKIRTKSEDNVEKNTQKPFMEQILENPEKGVTDIELREEAIVLIIAGTDTTATSASFTIALLARYTEVQEKVYNELIEVFGDSKRLITMEDMLQLKYLNAVVKETLRLYPPVPVIGRKIQNPLTLPSDVTLVRGTCVHINVWGCHRNPKYWGRDAEDFRPERFFDSPPEYPAAFMPFSIGPRNCIGYQQALMSIKIVVSTLLRRYKVLPAGGDPDCLKKEPLRVKFNIIMKDVDDYKVRLEIRK